MRKIIVLVSVLFLIFTISSCEKDKDTTPTNPLVGLWNVEKDTYQEGQSPEQTTFYDEPNLYFIDIKGNLNWVEEEFSGSEEPTVRNFKYKIIDQQTVLCYTRNENDGFEITYEKGNRSLILKETGMTQDANPVPYTYVRYLVN